MPQPRARATDRDALKSSRPPAMKPSTSLRRLAGSIRSLPELISSCSRSAYFDSRKNQFSSATSCGGVPWSGQFPCVELGVGVELLAADAVQALVGLAVQVTAGLAGPPEPLDARPVPRVAAGPDEVVEAERQVLAQPGERAGVAVDQRPAC